MPRRSAVPHRAVVLGSAVALALGGVAFVGSNEAAAQPSGRQGGPPSGAGAPRVNIRQNPGNDQGQANRERARQASGEVEAAQAALKQAQTKLKEAFEASPELVEAKRAAAEAQQAYDAAVRPVLETVRASPEYQKLDQAMQDAQAKLAAASGAPAKPGGAAAGGGGGGASGTGAAPKANGASGGVVGPSAAATRKASAGPGRASDAPVADPLTNAATDVMQQRAALRKLEDDAIAADPAAAEAKAKREETAKALADLKQGFEAKMHNDPEFAAAKKQLDEARARATAGGR